MLGRWGLQHPCLGARPLPQACLACLLPLQIKRMDMEARSLSQDKSKQLLSKVKHTYPQPVHQPLSKDGCAVVVLPVLHAVLPALSWPGSHTICDTPWV